MDPIQDGSLVFMGRFLLPDKNAPERKLRRTESANSIAAYSFAFTAAPVVFPVTPWMNGKPFGSPHPVE